MNKLVANDLNLILRYDADNIVALPEVLNIESPFTAQYAVWKDSEAVLRAALAEVRNNVDNFVDKKRTEVKVLFDYNTDDARTTYRVVAHGSKTKLLRCSAWGTNEHELRKALAEVRKALPKKKSSLCKCTYTSMERLGISTVREMYEYCVAHEDARDLDAWIDKYYSDVDFSQYGLKVLVACEASQQTTRILRRFGVEAYSSDLTDCYAAEDGKTYPEWHIMSDCTPLLNGECTFTTRDGKQHHIDSAWDMIVAHPPCTRLSHVCQSYYSEKCYTKEELLKHYKEREQAIEFFLMFTKTNCKHVAIENPVGYMNNKDHFRKPDDIVQPYDFGHVMSKATCLWLQGLKPLKRDDSQKRTCLASYCDVATNQVLRSRTFEGVACAWVTQFCQQIVDER